jgi:hypothetical protein
MLQLNSPETERERERQSTSLQGASNLGSLDSGERQLEKEKGLGALELRAFGTEPNSFLS